MTVYNNLPVIAMRGNFFFPNIRAKIELARDFSINAIKFALENGGKFLMVSQIDKQKETVNADVDLYRSGVVAEIASVENTSKDVTVVVARTLEVQTLSSTVATNKSFLPT
ncbi:MAG: LON peptidase substrate-binding domain-containing protein [Clostridia bacterium]|nr:LON peptidase substrate-binding domain-containing protein [Clostridia bacterium]